FLFFFQAEDGIRDLYVTGVQTCALPISLARRLKEAYPKRPLIISTTTKTGQELVLERMPFADAIIYFPLDWAFCVRRALGAVRQIGRASCRERVWRGVAAATAKRETHEQ